MNKLWILVVVLLTTIPCFAQEFMVKRDEFNDNARAWPAKNVDTYYSEIVNGTYIIQNKKTSGGFQFTRSWGLLPEKEFKLQAKIMHLSGVENKGYGLVWNDNKAKKTYYFIISSNGYYLIGGWEHGGDYFERKAWTKINLNPSGQYNTLSIDVKKGNYRFYLNGKEVHQGKNFSIDSSELGIEIFSGMKIKVDYIEVSGYFPKINLAQNLPTGLKKVNLGSKVNSKSDEVAQVISHDGLRIYFDRKDDPMGRGGDDAYLAQRNADNIWQKAVNMGKPINNSDGNFIISESPDGNTLLVGNTYKSDGSADGGGVSISHKTKTGWEIPKKQIIDDYYNDNKHGEYCLAPNRKVLIMTLERKDSYGEKDLYYSTLKSDNTWSEPKHMGSTINTKGNEIGPFLAADGRTLYFSSSGHPGYGSTDIFVSKRIGAGWTNWTKPANLGSEINSPGWEGYFSMDLFGEYAYLAANLGNGNGVDIYQIKLKEKETVVVTKDDHNETKKVLEDEVVIDENPKEEEKKPEEETLEITPNPVVIISGIVYDATTNLPLGASINYEDLDSHEQTGIASSDPNTGRYKIVLPFGLHYGFHAEAKLHYPVHENIDIKGAGKRVIEIERDLYLVPLEVGKAIRLNNVFFERGKPILLPSSYPELSRLVTLLKENPSIEIRLEGHTDNVGNPVELMKLSWDRVKAVAQYLSKQGISKNRITDKGYGRSKPAYPNDSEAHKAKNRRVEFVITKL